MANRGEPDHQGRQRSRSGRCAVIPIGASGLNTLGGSDDTADTALTLVGSRCFRQVADLGEVGRASKRTEDTYHPRRPHAFALA